MAAPSGTLTLAVSSVNSPNGLPRFCTAGCAETIYMSGITDVLFNSQANPDGTVKTENMVATGFTLDPSLEFGDFALRDDVMFHAGFGPMTAKDIAFSYNDANSVTNPESVHGQAGDFAPLLQSMESIDDTTLRLNYRNFDSRGMLHRFSMFWQTAAIVSTAVFDQYGVEGMQDVYIGVGPYIADEWSQNKGIFMTANPDYYAKGEGTTGPFVETVKILEVPEGASRRAMLETGEAQIAQVATKDIPELSQKGYTAQKGGLFNTIRDISFVGNYWDEFGGLSGELLERDRDISKPWIGNPFENGAYDENTPSMQNSRLVRNAFAWAIDREGLVENLLSGIGFVNHQAYLSSNNPNFKSEWEWGTDFAKAKSLLEEAGQGGGFEMDLWVGTSELGAEIGEAVGAGWNQNLNVKVNLIKTAYSTYRPGLVARTNKTPGVNICGDENKSNFPYDWAHGFVVSSISAGGYGVGQEIPYATETYSVMAGEPDIAKREDLSENFYTLNRFWANCVGIFEEPLWPMFNPDLVSAWDMRPMANGNIYTINNLRSVQLK
jgi:ABC-type transport system substrate-binding protein